MNKLIKTYLGFSIKSRAVVIGQDRLKACNDKVHLIICCSTASSNLNDLASRLADKFKCRFIVLDEKLEDYSSISGCKVLGLTNQSLADAIIKVVDKLNN